MCLTLLQIRLKMKFQKYMESMCVHDSCYSINCIVQFIIGKIENAMRKENVAYLPSKNLNATTSTVLCLREKILSKQIKASALNQFVHNTNAHCVMTKLGQICRIHLANRLRKHLYLSVV